MLEYLFQVNENTGNRIQEAGQLVNILILPVSLCEVHLFAPLNQLHIHQVHVLRTNNFTRLQRQQYIIPQFQRVYIYF